MLGHGAHGVVADACWYCAADPGRVGEKRVEAAIAAIVEVNVDTAVKCEHEVANGVCALDREAVAVEGGEKPGVFCTDELAGFIVRPELPRN